MAPAAWRPGTRQMKSELMQLLKLMYMIASFENFPRAISARDRMINLDIPQDLAIDKDIVDIYRIRRLTLYFGNVIRMAPYRHPHISLHGYIHGQRPRGRPRKKWMDNIREAEMDMSLIQASRPAWDRARWRNTIHNKGCQRAKTTSSLSPGH